MKGDSVRALAWEGSRHLAVGDVSSTRTVYAVVLALIGIGIVLVFVAIWLIRQTRPDPELLAPLEVMADRSWRKQDPAQKRRSLDDARPPGATPMQRQQGVPEIDEEFAQSKPAVASFDDLRAQQEAEQRRTAARMAVRADHDAEAEAEAEAQDAADKDNDGVALAVTDDITDTDRADETEGDADVDTGAGGEGPDDTGELDADRDELTQRTDD